MATDAILLASSRHAELIFTLCSVNGEHSVAELQRLYPIIRNLEDAVLVHQMRLMELRERNQKATQAQRPDKDSRIQRLVCIMTGRRREFEERLNKARLEELRATEAFELSQELLVGLRASYSCLRRNVEEAEPTFKLLDDLYDSIFAGSTVEFPEERFWQERVNMALATFTELDIQMCWASHVLQCLKLAEASIIALCAHLKEIVPRFVPNSSLAYAEPHKKQLVLGRATSYLREAQDMLHEAYFAQPDDQLLHICSTISDNLLVSQAFESPLSSTYRTGNTYGQLLAASVASASALEQLRTRIDDQTRWVASLPLMVEEAKEYLQVLRTDLRGVRRAIFERVVFESSNQPPDYEA